MNLKRKIATGLGGLALLAATLFAGCSKKDTEYVDIHHWQTPLSDRMIASKDGSHAGLMVQEKTDYEAYLFNNGTVSNASQDSVNSDIPLAFAGNNLVTMAVTPDNDSELKIYDSSGNLSFSSGVFPWVDDDIFVYDNGSKVLFEAHDTSNKIYLRDISAGTLEEFFPGASSSGLRSVSPDKSLVYLDCSDSGGYKLKLFNTADDSITNVLALSGHNVMRISQNNKKAILEYWAGINEELKVHDIENNLVQQVTLPANREFRWVDSFSDDGSGALVMLKNTTNDDWEWYHLDTDTPNLDLITTLPSSVNWFSGTHISSDGNVGAIRNDSGIVFLYNHSTPEFYDPLASVSKDNSRVEGFTLDDKVLLAYNEPMGWAEHYVLHDPSIKSNTPVSESGYDLRWGRFTPDKKYFAIEAEEGATGWEAVILKDFVNNTSTIIKHPEFSDLEYVGASPDSSRIYLEAEYRHLVAYDVNTGVFTQITDSEQESYGFRVLEHSEDQQRVFFEQELWNDTTMIRRYDFSTGLTDIVCYDRD